MSTQWKTIFRWGAGAFLLYLCVQYWPGVRRFLGTLGNAATPLIVGGVIAYLLNILTSFYEKLYFPRRSHPLLVRSRRPVCVMAAFLSLLGVLLFVLGLVLPQLVSCVGVILEAVQKATATLPQQMEQIGIFPEDILASLTDLADIDWKEKLDQVIHLLTNGLGSTMNALVNTVSTVFSSIVTAFLSLIFSIYLLVGKERLQEQCNTLLVRYMKPSWREKLCHVLDVTNDCFRRYIIGQCTEAVILGLLCILGMLILRLPYAVMIGTLIGFTALIPIAGAYIGAGAGAIMILMVSPVKTLIFLVFVVVLQQVEGNLIYPKVVGSSIGLPAIWVFCAVTIGGGILGILGMLLAVPLTAAVYRLLDEDIHRPLQQPAAPEET